jgi:hypothetical protein
MIYGPEGGHSQLGTVHLVSWGAALRSWAMGKAESEVGREGVDRISLGKRPGYPMGWVTFDIPQRELMQQG